MSTENAKNVKLSPLPERRHGISYETSPSLSGARVRASSSPILTVGRLDLKECVDAVEVASRPRSLTFTTMLEDVGKKVERVQQFFASLTEETKQTPSKDEGAAFKATVKAQGPPLDR